MTKLKALFVLFSALATYALLSSCATLNQIGQQTLGSQATAELTRDLSTDVYKGQAWNMPYVVSREPGGTYDIRQLPGTRTTPIGQFLSLRKVGSYQTDTFGADVFLTPTQGCPNRYLLVVAHGNADGHVSQLGCREALVFQEGSDHRVLYATETGASGFAPLAYRIDATQVQGPDSVDQIAGYPQRSQPPAQATTATHAAMGATTSGYAGQVWGVAYDITRGWNGTYSIRKAGSTHSNSLGQLLSVQKVYSAQTKTFGMDAFAAPTRDCPRQYLLVFGSAGNHAQYKSLGCLQPLTFSTGSDGRVYATQAAASGATPLAYTITEHQLRGPQPITQLAGYPQRGTDAAAPSSRMALPATQPAMQPVAQTVHANHQYDLPSSAGLGPVAVPAAAPAPHASAKATAPKPSAPVTIDLGGDTPK